MLLLPGATWRPISYRTNAHPFPNRPQGWCMHVVVGNGSPLSYWERLPVGDRAFAHAWVAKDGHSEQYQDLAMQAWAAVGANPLYWHFETEGFQNEPLTAAQIHTLATWHNFLKVPDQRTPSLGAPGIACHFDGGAAWGNHDCPDAVPGKGPRSLQIPAIIALAKQLRSGGPVEPLTLAALMGWDATDQVGEPANLQTVIGRVYKRTAQITDMMDALQSLGAQVQALQQAVAALAAHPAPPGP